MRLNRPRRPAISIFLLEDYAHACSITVTIWRL
jgi:hypothetical protein